MAAHYGLLLCLESYLPSMTIDLLFMLQNPVQTLSVYIYKSFPTQQLLPTALYSTDCVPGLESSFCDITQGHVPLYWLLFLSQ